MKSSLHINLCFWIALLIGMAASTSCNETQEEYRIGVSQCAGGDWRDKMNDEMRREALFHPRINFTFCNANDDYQLQIRQIDSLAAAGVDLLVVAPSDSLHLSEAVARVRARGIPVIVTDRRLGSGDYDAFVGGDNRQVGLQAAEYLSARLPAGGKVVEICGDRRSTPAEERHTGLVDGLSRHPQLQLVASVDGSWHTDSARAHMQRLIRQYPDLNAVVAHNDYMAMSAADVVRQMQNDQQPASQHDIVFVGVDAVYGQGHGLEMISRGVIDASILYPTCGDVIVRKAVHILDEYRATGHYPQERDSILSTYVVEAQGAALLNDMDLAVLQEVQRVKLLESRQLQLLSRLNLEQVLLFVLAVALLAILLFAVSLYYHYSQKQRTALRLVHLNRQLRDMAHLQLSEMRQSRQQDPHSSQAPVSSPQEPVPPTELIPELDPFLEKVYQTIEQNYTQTDFGVEYLSVLLDLSRSQLYRKVKAVSGVTPLDLIHEVRFREAKRFFHQGLSPEEVAPRVGYTSVTYFMKSYEEYLAKME